MTKLRFSLVLLFFPVLIFAQTTKGTEFWIAYLENLELLFNGPPAFSVVVHADQATTGTISVPAAGFSQGFSVAAGEVQEIFLPNAIWYTEGSELVDNKGIKVTAQAPISVMVYHYRLFFTESSLVLPVEELGTNYRASCFQGEDWDAPSSFVIVSTEDSNEIEITPNGFTEGLRPANVPFTITLDAGQTYQVRSFDDLSGSYIRSLNGKKMAVFSGSERAWVACVGFADNHLYDQLLPTDRWGDAYFYVPFKGQGGDLLRFIGQEDDTDVFLGTDPLFSLDAGTWGEVFTLEDPVIIRASKPILVSQYNKSQDCNDSGLGDPSVLHLFPVTNQMFGASWNATDYESYIAKHFVNIVVKSGNTGLIELDGSFLPPGDFSFFPQDSLWSYLQLEVGTGEHTLVSDSLFYAYAYGFGDYDAYTFNLGYDSASFPCADLPEVTVQASADTYCVGDTLEAWALTDAGLVDWLWKLESGDAFATDTLRLPLEAAGSITLVLEALDAAGCGYSAVLDLEVQECLKECEMQFPNVFTPNGDGTNDTFKGVSECEPAAYELRVYNRWGELVFETVSFEESWDATRDGKPLSSDVYVFIARYRFEGATEQVVTGDVTLLR